MPDQHVSPIMQPPYRTLVTNVLVIGAGGGPGCGLPFAAHLAGCEVVVVGKRLRRDAQHRVGRRRDQCGLWEC